MKEEEAPLFLSHIATAQLRRSPCYLGRLQLTQQMYFSCEKALEAPAVHSDAPAALALFDNSNLFPPMKTENRRFENAFVELRLNENLDFCSQVFAFVSTNASINLNLSIEVKLPNRLYRSLSLIQSRMLNKSKAADKVQSKTSASLFEQVFQTIESPRPNSSFVEIGLEDGSEVLVPEKLDQLERELAIWHSPVSFRVASSRLSEEASLNWSEHSSLNCSLVSLRQRYKYLESARPINLETDFRLLADLRCYFTQNYNQFVFFQNVLN